MQVRQQGFTLVEMMVVAALLGILVTGVMTFFTTQKKNASMNTQVIEIQQKSRLLGDLFEPSPLPPTECATSGASRAGGPRASVFFRCRSWLPSPGQFIIA